MSTQPFVIAALPFVDTDCVLAAPAVLKANLEHHGIPAVALDLNIEIYNKIQNHPSRQKFVDFFFRQKIHDDIVDDLVRMIRFCAEEILGHRPGLIGLSLFCKDCKYFTAWLCAALRQQAPHIPIVIGGPGMETLETGLFRYPDRLQQLGLIDDYIAGDGEQSIVDYAQGRRDAPGINGTAWVQVDDINALPIPDYSDYRLFRYGHPKIPIMDSRGCVQDCEFCDVVAIWDRYQYLTADAIWSQMMAHIDRYGVRYFEFRSSICNGNLREFRRLMRLIADHNRHHRANEQLHWEGSFIIRSSRAHNEELWQDLRDSNGFLFTGVESVIESVRRDLGKRFTNDDLEYHLEMGRRYQVPMILLFIAAYPGETLGDWETTKQWFRDHRSFAQDTVKAVQVTKPQILPGTQLERTVDAEKFKSDQESRTRYWRELVTMISQECGFRVEGL